MKSYILRSDDVYCSHDGMTIETINSLLAELGYTGKIITETEYLEHSQK